MMPPDEHPFRVPGTSAGTFPGVCQSVLPTVSPRRSRGPGGNAQHPTGTQTEEPPTRRPSLLEAIDTGRAPRSAVAFAALLAALADHRWHHVTELQAAATATGITLWTAADIIWAASRAGRIQRDHPHTPQYYRLPYPAATP